MSDIVEYIVKLKDEMSGTLNAILHSTHEMNKEIKHSQSVVHELRNAFFELFAFEKVVEFIGEASSAFAENREASAQLAATIESTNNAMGLSSEALEEQSKALAKNSMYEDDAITRTQALLGTFTKVKGVIFTDAIPAIVNMSAKLKTDLQSSALQVGKALNDPIAGITALKRAGVSFTESQKNTIKSLVDTGQEAKAQQMILAELNTEFGGSAQAARDAATPFARFKHDIHPVVEEIGELVVQLQEKLVPVLEVAVQYTSEFVKWIKENKEVLKVVAVAVSGAAAAWLIYESAVKAVAIAQTILNLIMEANPIFMIITAIGLAVAVVYQAYQQFEGFRKALNATWEVIKGLGKAIWDDMIAPFEILYHTVNGVWDAIQGNFKDAKEDFKKAGEAMLKPFEDVIDAIDNARDAYGKSYTVKSAGGEGGDKKKVKNGLGIEPPTENLNTGASSVKETKPTIINITMGSLVNTFTVGVTNLQEGSAKVREEILKAMISAVNDSQVHAIGNT
jgi:hypothetical protein